MKKIIFILIALSLNNAHSKTIANCSSPSGYSFYSYIGLATKGDSGWAEDKISGMRATLKLLDDKFDILFVDATNTVTSSLDSGAKIIPIIATEDYFSVLNLWIGRTAEIYTFWKNKDNQYKFSLAQVKSGLISKSSVMVGDCSFIDFSWAN